MGRLFDTTSKATTTTQTKPTGRLFPNPVPKQPSTLSKIGTVGKSIAKEVASAAVTVPARIPQAIAALSGVSDQRINEVSSKYSGGLIAPTPQKAGDVIKDVGRVIETGSMFIPGSTAVKLAAGGAVSGLGTSLKEGFGLIDTVKNIVIGGGFGYGLGKVVGKVGSMYANRAGKEVVEQGVKEAKISQGASNIAENATIIPDNTAQPRKFTTKDVKAANDIHSYVGSGKTISVNTIEHLKQNPVGINDLPTNPDGTVTLYREGDLTPGQPQSYSLTRLENDLGQVEVRVPKANVLANLNSKEVDDLYNKAFTQQQKDAGYLEQRRLNKSESEVIATTPAPVTPEQNADILKFVENDPTIPVTERQTNADQIRIVREQGLPDIENTFFNYKAGSTKLPTGTNIETYYKALLIEAKKQLEQGDSTLYTKLFNSPVARNVPREAGQGLQVLSNLEEGDMLQRVFKLRTELEDKLPQVVKARRTKEIADFEKNIRSIYDNIASKPLNKKTISDIIDSVICPA
jgi:hypothetical protein